MNPITEDAEGRFVALDLAALHDFFLQFQINRAQQSGAVFDPLVHGLTVEPRTRAGMGSRILRGIFPFDFIS